MTSHPESEKTTTVTSSGGLIKLGGGEISAITLDGGTASTGATALIADSTTSGGTGKWALRAAQYQSASISFPKPLQFTSGIYLTLTPTGLSAKVSIAYT